jgi:hypothetical protein
MRNRPTHTRHLEQVLLGLLNALTDGLRRLTGLTHADTHMTLPVTDDHHGSVAEAPPTLDDLRAPIKKNETLLEIQPVRVKTWHSWLLEIQTGFARRVGETLNPSVVEIPTTIEHNLGNSCCQRSLGNKATNGGRLLQFWRLSKDHLENRI